jgi:hypothetical protein
MLTEALKFIDETSRSLFARAQGFSLTLLLLFLAEPSRTVQILGSGGGLIHRVTTGIVGFFQLNLPKDSDTPAIITFCLLFLCVQLAFLAHDAVLNVIGIVLPATCLLLSYRRPIMDEAEQAVRNLVFKSFKPVMTRMDFEQLFAIYKAKIRLSDDIRNLVKEATAQNIPWLRERIVAVLAVLILVGGPGYHLALFTVMAVLSTWSIYKANTVSQVNSLAEYQTSVLAAVELLKDRLNQSFAATLAPEEEMTVDRPAMLQIMLVVGTLRLSYIQKTLAIHLGIYDWTVSWNRDRLAA